MEVKQFAVRNVEDSIYDQFGPLLEFLQHVFCLQIIASSRHQRLRSTKVAHLLLGGGPMHHHAVEAGVRGVAVIFQDLEKWSTFSE